MSSLDEQKTADLVSDALLATGAARRRNENKLIEYLYVSGVMEVWANSLANRHGEVGVRHREDLVSVIAVALTRWLQELEPSRLEDVQKWPSFMFRIAAFGVRDYLNSSQVTVASKMSAFARRTRYIGYAQEKLRDELEREPTREEVIEFANAEAARRLKDPKRQGALIDHQDFGDVARPAADVSELNMSSPAADANLAERMRVGAALSRVVEECRRRSPDDKQLMSVVNEWVDIVASGDEPTPHIISRSLGLSMTATARALDTLMSVLVEVRENPAVAA